eukprot:CAMPEP_0181424100 /NCGR_PEP_ID=MMETSP1110-20121109/14469_1 /TAXON_ID=174948 /ORGANISM="Symbiodinium sp., Strain CCMP421" /LENGTH=365 /DNA_ID=CAMNT_0023547245 /DNA_START=45 /DNA_END=1142 /DNA_ORIENTATION=-
MGAACAKVQAEEFEAEVCNVDGNDERLADSCGHRSTASPVSTEEDADGHAVVKTMSRMSISSHLSTQSLAVNYEEVKPEKVLCTTVKSRVSLASWQGQQVANKQLQVHESMDDSRAELLHEVQILSSLEHPCLVRLMGANVNDASPTGPFMLTEFMEHGDVETYMQKQRQKYEDPVYKPRFSVAMGWAMNAGEALRYLHGLPSPIIHRDLKPLNLFLTKDLQVKVGDFGISKMLPSRLSGDAEPAPNMTGGVGTWRYMAPEVARHEAYTEKMDIYAYGLIMYYIFSGRQPFFAYKDVEDILKAFIRKEEPRPDLKCLTNAELRAFLPEAWHQSQACRPSAAECLSCLSGIKAPTLRQSMMSFFRG